MSKIKIKNFGPIKEGYLEDEGWIYIKKVTVFIGNQSAGKSCIAKLISTFKWLEKALYRGVIKQSEVTRKNKFEKTYCDYHRLKNYFQSNTIIEYIGTNYLFYYGDGKLDITLNNNPIDPVKIINKKLFAGINLNKTEYLIPKIMYVPAERNFLSSVVRPEKLKGLPLPLYTFLEEYDKAQEELTESISLPIGTLKFHYQKLNKIANIVGDDYKIRLLDSSSGLQSLVPLFLVSRNIALSINKKTDASKKEISVEEEKKLKAEIQRILADDKLSDDIRKAAFEVLSAKYKNACFINIVEEPEQNLFPNSQRQILNSLMGFNNMNHGNKLIITTHSPYIINYLTLAVKASSVLNKINSSALKDELNPKLCKIVPLRSTVKPDDLVIYELDEKGNIIKLEDYKGLPSDENYLNEKLGESNELFANLLEIEDQCR